MSILSSAGRRLLTAMPAKRSVLRVGGRLPPAFRTQASYRLLTALYRIAPDGDAIARTNMGISRQLNCEVPGRHTLARFGAPDLYAGERGALQLARWLSRQSDAFVDIGAHTGYFTFYVRAGTPDDLPIHFFEPSPVLFDALTRNVATNQLPNVRGFQEAVGSSDGAVTFYADRTDSLTGSVIAGFAQEHEVDRITVPMVRFDSVATKLSLTRACVKVDVEGAERAFLDGAGDALGRIRFLIMEVLTDALRSGFIRDVIARGFHAYYINDLVLEPSLDGTFDYRDPECNWLFCREAPQDLARLLEGSRLRVASGGVRG